MAEGGQENDDQNPFSFKSFVGKKGNMGKERGNAEIEDDFDIFDIPDTDSQRKREKKKQIQVVDEDASPKTKKKGNTENPFSFKKFLSGPSTGTSKTTAAHQSQNSREKSEKHNHRRYDNSTLPIIPSDLPDFVQDHYSDILGLSGSPGIPDNDLPAYDLVDNDISANTGSNQRVPDIGDMNVPSDSLIRNTNNPSSTGTLDLIGNDEQIHLRLGNNESTVNDSDDDFDDDNDIRLQPHSSAIFHSLPDFLSNTAVVGGSDSPETVDTGGSGSRNTGQVSDDLDKEIRRLHQENVDLKRRLEESRNKRQEDADRICELQRQMVSQKAKEAEETAVMDRAMEQVEENLSQTTTRAVQADSMVTKLKQEVKTLQAEIKSLRGENGMLGSKDQHLCDIRERTQYVAEQLSSATKTAESSLRQLLSGVDNLKLLSQVLESIDKITEEKPTDDQPKTNFDGT